MKMGSGETFINFTICTVLLKIAGTSNVGYYGGMARYQEWKKLGRALTYIRT